MWHAYGNQAGFPQSVFFYPHRYNLRMLFVFAMCPNLVDCGVLSKRRVV